MNPLNPTSQRMPVSQPPLGGSVMSATPSKAQQQWMELGYGLFIHFGPNTFTATGWGDGKFPAADFHPAQLSTDQWAELAAAAGMKYAVLTTKHHDGFCLWPSRHTDYCTKNSPGRPDIVGRFVESCRKAGIRPGLYYSLWDRNYPRYEDDAVYADYMFGQIEELLSHYGPILELWFDGGWDKDHPTRQWPYDPAWAADPRSGLTHGQRWRWRQLYQHIHRLQPECLVVMNSSSDRPGGIKYHPVDIRTSEHFNFIWQETVREPVLDPVFTDPERGEVYLPLEYCTSLNPKWFWNEGDCYSHPSVETICGWYRQARASNANFLLNAGPDQRGLLPPYHRRFLANAASELGLRG